MLQQVARRSATRFADSDRDPRLIERMIARMPLFLEVAPTNVELIAAQAQIQRYRRGAVIAQQGERPPGVIVFIYGQGKITLPRCKGEGKVIRFLGPNDSFGESAVVLERPSAVDVVALADSMTVLLPAKALLELFERDAQFARNVARMLAGRCIQLVVEIEAGLRQSALQRLASYLASLAEPNGTPDTGLVKLPTSKTAIAARLGIKKETMSRLLRELADRGLIAVARREIEVHDLPGLAGLAR
jgi:CRP/FNR family transcriptional activator FtrB